MKVFQVFNGVCHWDATRKHQTLESTIGRYAPTISFVEAPDSVFEGWGYDTATGEFIQPEPPPGWLYDSDTGTFYPEDGELIPPLRTVEELEAELADARAALDMLGYTEGA